jgi:aminoglycoside 6'-N-acetyltransferase
VDAAPLAGERVTLRALTDEDVPRVTEINALPEVARWWSPRDAEYLDAKLRAGDLACWVVEVDGEVVGYAQACEHTHAEFRHAGLDLFLHPGYHGRGLGQDVVRTVCRHLVDDLGHHRIVIDPAEANARAVRCYEAVGFRRVGVMRSYWWDHAERRWADGLLLDLLAEDLTQGISPTGRGIFRGSP